MKNFLVAMSQTPLNDARVAAAAGTPAGDGAAYDYWRLIHDELDVEHREWHGVANVVAGSTLTELRRLKLPRFTD